MYYISTYWNLFPFFALISRSKENNLKKIENVWADMLVASKLLSKTEVQLSPIHLLVMQRRGPIRPLVLTLTDLVQWISNSWSMTNNIYPHEKSYSDHQLFFVFIMRNRKCKVVEMYSTPQ